MTHPLKQSFEPGSYVLLYVPKVPKGTYSKWAIFYQGPYKVIRKLNSHNYVVRKTPKSKDLVVHCDRLRPYFAGIQGTLWQKHESAKVHSENSDHVGTDTVNNSDSTSMHSNEQVGASATGHEDSQQPITAAAKLSRQRRQAGRPARYCQRLGVRRIHCLSHGSEEDGRHCSSELCDYSGSKTVVGVECESIAPRERFIDCRRASGDSNYRRRRKMSKRAGANTSLSDSDAGGHDENGRDGRAGGLPDPTGPSGPPPGRGQGRGRRLELNHQEDTARGAAGTASATDRYRSDARGRDQPVVVLHDARHLLDDAGTASATRYCQHARGTAGTSSATDRYPDDARGDRYRDRGDADRYSPGTGRAPPPRNQGADRQSTGDDRAPPTDEPEVPTANRKRQRRRRGGRAFSPRPCRPCRGGRIFKSSSGLRRHAATEHHMYFRRPDAYVPIPPDKLEAVLRSIHQGQVHRCPKKKSAGTRKKNAQVRQVFQSVRTPSPAWDLDGTGAPPPAAVASAAAGRPLTPSFAIEEDEGVFLAGQGRIWSFQSCSRVVD